MEITILILAIVVVMQFVSLLILMALARTNVKLVEWLSGATEGDEEEQLKQARLEYWAKQTGYDYSMLKAMMDSRDAVNLDAQPQQNYDGVGNFPKRPKDGLTQWMSDD